MTTTNTTEDTEREPEGEPQFAFGTDRKRTGDGWTRASQFIAGDPQVPGMVNPEKIQLRVRNGRPEARVTPLSRMLRGRGQMPQFADGTEDPWAWRGADWNLSDTVDAFGNSTMDASYTGGSGGGYSTASQQIREMGFGAGMGLYNIKSYSDQFDISSEVDKGTFLKMIILHQKS